MNFFSRLLHNFKPRPAVKEAPPIINTPYGPVTESARQQASINMRNDADLRERVLAHVIKECGGDEERGLTEFMRRYPETFADFE